jgi:hypothetical protein
MVTLPTVGSTLLYKSKLSELWLLHNPEPHVEVYLVNQEILPVPCHYVLSLINSIIHNQEKFSNKFMYIHTHIYIYTYSIPSFCHGT